MNLPALWLFWPELLLWLAQQEEGVLCELDDGLCSVWEAWDEVLEGLWVSYPLQAQRIRKGYVGDPVVNVLES
jgi:hypothetical protein